MSITAVGTWIAAPGAQFNDTDAQTYGPRLAELAGGLGGALSPETVVEAARQVSDPLHRYFEWDDTVAGEAWRKQQARQLVNHIRIVYKGGGESEKAFFSIRLQEQDDVDDGPGRAYVPIQIVEQTEEYREQVIAHALNEARAWRRRYQQYKELRPIVRAIVRMERKRKGGTGDG